MERYGANTSEVHDASIYSLSDLNKEMALIFPDLDQFILGDLMLEINTQIDENRDEMTDRIVESD